MRKFKLFLSLLMVMALSLGNVWGADPDVTYDFTGSDWSVSGSELTNGTVSFTGAAGGSKGSFKMNSGYLMLGKKGAYLNFPTYSSAVKQIVVTGRSGASGSTIMNIYVGNTAVSTETTGSTGENSYDIATASQTAGTTYTLNVTSDHNAQITKIEIYYAEAAPSCTKTVSVTKVTPTNGDFAISATEVCGDGDGGEVTISDIEPATGYALDEVSVTVGTYDKNTGKVTGITEDTEISVTFKELQKYTVSFNTGAGNPAVSPIEEATAGAGITLPAGPTPACSADGWTFAGWAAEAVASETTSAPTLLSGKYNPTDNVTLYAVYKRTEGGSGAAVNTVMWSENFTGIVADAKPETPTDGGSSVYGDATITYEYTDGGTKTKGYTTGGPNNNENLLVSKANGAFTVKGIPTGGATTLTVTHTKSGSGVIVVSTPTENVTLDGETLTIGNPSGISTFDLVFSNTNSSNNERLDDMIVKVATTSAAGTTYYLSAPSCCTKYNIELALGIQHGSISADLAEACEGTEVTLTATPNEHCAFVAWDVKQGETPVAVSDNKFTMPAGDVTVSATFAEIKNAVTFAAPTGGTLSILNGEEAVTTGAEIVEGTALTVTATPDAEKHYIGGTIKVVKTSDESDVTASVLDGSTLTMPNYAITVSATFTPTYAIKLDAEGGSIALEYTKGGAADGYAIAGTTINAEATADDAHVFVSLAVSDNVTEPTIVDYLAEFVMPAEAVTITATFNEKSTPTIATDVTEVAFDATDYKGELAAKTFYVNGVALAEGNLTIACDNDAFTVSPTSIPVNGALEDTEITVTPKTTACGTFNATITISGGNAVAKEVAVSLTVNKLPANLAWSAEEATVTIDANDNVFPTLTNPRNLPVVYSSLYDEVASIDENGAVTLKKAGETMIIVNFAGNDTVTALAKDALYYTLTVQQKYTVEWYINGAKKGEQTAVAGVELENIPDATSIENGAIAGKVFRGWAESAIDGETDEAGAGIVATPTVMPSANKNYYAVYAIEEGDAEPALSQTLSYDTWTYSGTTTDKSTYRVFGSDSQIESAEFDLTTLAQVNVYAGTFGNLSDKSVKITDGTNTWGTFTMSTKSQNTKNEVTSEVALTGTGKIYVIPNDGDGSGSGARISKVEIYTQKPISYTKYATSGPKKLANPTFSVEEGTYTETKSIELNAADGTIYYTLDGTEPTTESTLYTAAIALDSYGSYTIKAIAAKEDGSKSDVVTATYGINIPFETVTDLFTYIESGKAFLGNISVTGVVSEIVTEYSTDHKNITFNISDTGAESEAQFQSYRGVGEGIAEKVAVGDKVTITGEYVLFGTTHELKQGNVISNRVAAEVSSVVISGEANQTTYDAGDSFKFEGLVATANYNTGYTKVVTDEENVWTADPDKVTVSGDVNVTATYGGMTSVAEVIAVTIKSYAVTFEDPENGTLVVKNGEEAIASGDAFAKGTVLTVETKPASEDYKAGVVTVTGATLEGNTITVGSTDFTVSVVFAEKAEAGIEWSTTYGEIQVQGTEIVNSDLPSLTNPYELTITYSSEDTDVAEIDPATGVITPKADGYTTISANFAGNEDYKAAQVSFNLTVEAVAQPEFYLIGSFNGWNEFVPVYDTWYQFENLTPGDHQLKVTTAPNWDDQSQIYGYDALTVKHAGLSKDNDGNICFTISNEINLVSVEFEKNEEGLSQFTVTGTYAKPTFTVVGVEALVGYNWEAGLNEKKNEMVEDPETGNYELVKENVELAAGDYEYQVAKDHKWRDVPNSKLTITESGIYNVTFTFVPSTGTTSATPYLVEHIDILPTMKIAGDWDKADENKWNENALIVAGDKKNASYTATNLVKGTYYHFWIIQNGVYMSGNKGFDRENLSADLTNYSTGDGSFAMYFQADQDGDYTFTWTYDTNVITMTFPYKEATALDNTEAGETAVKVMQNGQLLIIKNGKTYNAQGQIIK